MPQVTAYHDDGTTDSVPATVNWELKETLGQMWRLTIDLERADAQSLNLVTKADEVKLSGYRRGVLADIEKGESTWTLVVYSPEWYANRHAPTAGGTLVQGDDNTLINNQIDRVTEWSAGTIATLTGPMTFVFNHALANEALRKIEKNVPGELEFESDGTVNYTDQRGTDRSGSVTLSASAGTIEQRIKVVNRGRKLDATHVRVIGAHEGEAQYFANLVPSDDGATYENRVNYTTPRWSSGDPRDWDRWQNKDVMSQDTIKEEAAALAEELKEQYVEVKTTVSGVDLNLGDFVQVTKPDADIDRKMRVHQLKTRSIDDTPAGTYQDVTLSTRTIARQDLGADRRDIQRFNTAFQGSAVWGTLSGGRQPVNSSLNYELPVYYPAVEYEHKTELYVRGLNYRAYSSGAASGGTNITDNNSEYGKVDERQSSGNITGLSGGTWHTLDSYSPSVNTSEVAAYWMISKDPVVADIRLYDSNANEYIPDSDGQQLPGDVTSNTLVVPGDHNGNTLEIQINPNSSMDIVYNVHWNAIGQHQHTLSDHTHPVDAGIIEFSNTPSGVDVIVNGTTVSSNVGTGAFETLVDITGKLNRGQWNLVELSSDSLGHLGVTLSSEAYRQLGTN